MESPPQHGESDIGVIGLGTMGRNLALNIHDHGYAVSVFNRTTAKVDEFLEGDAAGTAIRGTHSLEELVASLRLPRTILIMIEAGQATDQLVATLAEQLSAGDILIDGGNSLYTDTIRRSSRLETVGIEFVGAGISGGAEGARTGPSIMPGGSPRAWPQIQGILQSIAASVDGIPCCDWVGTDGAGHYLKMVHNGIEYGDMQVLAEAYDVMHRGLGLDYERMEGVFRTWNAGRLDSYLVEITADIMRAKDDRGEPMLEQVLDTASQKGTGKWTVVSSMELGQPTTLAAAAVYARVVSALRDQRVAASHEIEGPNPAINDSATEVIEDLHDAVYASKIVSYAQGFMLLQAAAVEHNWDLNFQSIAAMWRGGCIIRSRFLGELMDLFAAGDQDPNILLSDFFGSAVEAAQGGWRRTVARATLAGIAVPAYSSALSFFDAFRSAQGPANLTQAQRDYFGAHGFERIDRERGTLFHFDWSN